MRIFENLNIDFLGKRKMFYAISGGLLLIGLLSILFRGLQFGIDFKGGSEIVLEFQEPIDVSEMRNYVGSLEIGNIEVKTFGAETGVLISSELQNIPEEIFPKVVENIEQAIERILPGIPREIVSTTLSDITYSLPNPDTTSYLVDRMFLAGYQAGKVSQEPTNTQMVVRVGISDWIKENLKTTYTDNPFKVIREDRVGPKIGQELKKDALIAIIFALLAILIYLGIRFKFIFAFGAVVALFHDVLITLGLYSLLYGVFPWLNLDISLTVVAAFLTIIGYSINDTVVVFDRIRESLRIHRTKPLQEVINSSINKTMSRTVITGVTSLITLVVLLFFGGEVLRSFAFTLVFGILIGTYSSIFIASALVLEYATRRKKKVEF